VGRWSFWRSHRGDTHQELAEPTWGIGDVGLQETLEAEQGFLVEHHQVDIVGSDTPSPEAIRHRVGGESVVVSLAGESLLLRSGHDPALLDQGHSAVVIERRYPQDVQATSSILRAISDPAHDDPCA
jgi:hypothetical protein